MQLSTSGEQISKVSKSRILEKQFGISTVRYKGLAMNLHEAAAKAIAQDVIQDAMDSSELESRVLALVNMSIELHKASIDLRLQAEELLNFLTGE
jgi:hypothetical protein